MMPEQRLVVPERGNTVTGECLGCLTQFAIDGGAPAIWRSGRYKYG